MSSAHYLICADEDCERVACVDRRDYEHQIDSLKSKLAVAKETMDAAAAHLLGATPLRGGFVSGSDADTLLSACDEARLILLEALKAIDGVREGLV